MLLSGGQRMIEGDVDNAVAVFDVKHYRVAADFVPVANDAQAVVAAGHHAGQVDGAGFEILGDGDGFLYNGHVENARDDQLFTGVEKSSCAVAVRLADGFGEFARSQVASLPQVLARNGGNAVSALGLVDNRSGGRNEGSHFRSNGLPGLALD